MVLFLLFTLVCSLPLVTLGSSIIALSSTVRQLAEYREVKVLDWFVEFRRTFVRGLPYSFLLLLLLTSLYTISQLLMISGVVSGLATFSLVGVLLALWLTFWYPYAAYSEPSMKQIFVKALQYGFGHKLDTLAAISVMLIVMVLTSFNDVILIFFLPLAFVFTTCRILVANNAQVDEESKVKGN
jgi:uncharacterized membrane protein YesL